MSNFKDASNRKIYLPALLPLFTNILYETANKTDFSLEITEANIMQILIAAYRTGRNLKTPGMYSLNMQDGLIYKIVNFIDKNFASITNLSDLAQNFNYDYSYLATLFKSVMNRTIKNYLQDKKISYAKTMLETSEMSVTEISEYLSYSSVHNFSRAYKNYYGISPREHKKTK